MTGMLPTFGSATRAGSQQLAGPQRMPRLSTSMPMALCSVLCSQYICSYVSDTHRRVQFESLDRSVCELSTISSTIYVHLWLLCNV